MINTNKLLYALNHSSRNQKIILLTITDLIFNFISTWISFFLLLDHTHQINAFLFEPSKNQIIVFSLFLIVYILIFTIFGVYRSITRHVNLNSFIQIGISIAVITIIMISIIFFFKFYGVPRSIALVQPIIFFILVISSRLLIRQAFINLSSKNMENIMIYGAGEAGVQAFHSISQNKNYKIIAFIDEDKNKIGLKINNIKIISSSKISKYVERHKVSLILLCIPSLDVFNRRRIKNNLSSLKIRIKTLPGIDSFINNIISFENFSDLGLDEILERKTKIDFKNLNKSLKNSVVLITGAGGSIGSEISKQVIGFDPKSIILLDNSEYNLYLINNSIKSIIKSKNKNINVVSKLVSVVNKGRIDKLFYDMSPKVIFHAAAYKHLPIVEENVIEAIENNVYGTKNIIDCAKKYQSKKLILISTDKAVRSTSVMGSSKRLSEMLVQAYASQENHTDHLVLSMVRFGNVLNSSGSIVPLFRKQINEGGPITITHPDVTRYFMTISEAVSLVLYSSFISKGGEVYVLDMGKPVKILDLARKMLTLSGLTERSEENQLGDIEIKYIGLREGEKINEELLFNQDAIKVNKDIMIAKDDFIPMTELMSLLNDLDICIANNDEKGIISILKKNISPNLLKS